MTAAQRRSSAAAFRPTPTPRVSDWDHFSDAKKLRSRAPEAVGCNAMFGVPASLVRAPRACANHACIVPRLHNGRSVSITPIWDHAPQNGPSSEPRPSGITLPITGCPHNGPSYHTPHNGQSAQRGFLPHPDCMTHICSTELRNLCAAKRW